MPWPRARRPHLSRDEMLASRPVVHPLLRRIPQDDGSLTILIPVRPAGLGKVAARFLKAPAERSLVLDTRGARAVTLCDGKRTVEDVIRAFAKEQRLTLREASVAMLEYLKALAQRNIIAFAVAQTEARTTSDEAAELEKADHK